MPRYLATYDQFANEVAAIIRRHAVSSKRSIVTIDVPACFAIELAADPRLNHVDGVKADIGHEVFFLANGGEVRARIGVKPVYHAYNSFHYWLPTYSLTVLAEQC